MIRKSAYIIIVFVLISQAIKSQPGIYGKLSIDTSVWAPTVYLSLIPDLESIYTISNEMIIDRVLVSDSGSFVFDTKYLPDEDVLLRFHISKKGDLPASLNIGGRDENHFFLVANRKSTITIKSTSKSEFIRNRVIQGYAPNQTLIQICRIASYSDTVSLTDPTIKTEFIRSAIFEKLRTIADTCSNPIVALFALYKSRFDKNYSVNQQFYERFLTKWKQQKSEYFKKFRDKIPYSHKKGLGLILLVAVLSLVVGFCACLIYYKLFNRKQNLIQNLSVQERKIYALLMEGKSNKEISENLMIEQSTVKSHVNNIYSKLEINSRKDLMNLNHDKK
jgi:DNA-binding CsgD family transcriptional regulator